MRKQSDVWTWQNAIVFGVKEHGRKKPMITDNSKMLECDRLRDEIEFSKDFNEKYYNELFVDE